MIFGQNRKVMGFDLSLHSPEQTLMSVGADNNTK